MFVRQSAAQPFTVMKPVLSRFYRTNDHFESLPDIRNKMIGGKSEQRQVSSLSLLQFGEIQLLYLDQNLMGPSSAIHQRVIM